METNFDHVKEFGLKKPITNIGIICSANTSRSPTVETVLKKELETLGVKGVKVWSAGIINLPGANTANKVTKETLTERGYPEIERHTPRFIEDEEVLRDLRESDLVLTMDHGQSLFLTTDLKPIVKGLDKKTMTLRGFVTGREKILYEPTEGKESIMKKIESLRIDDPHWNPQTYKKRFSELIRLSKQLAAIIARTHGKN